MKSPITLTGNLVAVGVAVLPLAAQAESYAAACTDQTLNVGVQMTQDPFFRQFHNQDLAQSVTQLRTSAKADMAAGNMESCGIKAATINAMVKDPARARVTLAEYLTRQAAVSGAAVPNTHSVRRGHHFTQKELMGTSLRSLNNETLGTITGVVYSQTGQPLYVTVTPTATTQATTPVGNMVIPVGMLLVGRNPGNMYISLSSEEFWKEPRFRDVQVIQPAG